MHKNNYSLEVLINGRPAQEYYKENKSFVEARGGSEYTLRFRNNSHRRIMAIFSVDGVDVLKGKVAEQADSGYIVDAFSNIEIKGYRIDENNVAVFKFADTNQSYAATVGGEKEIKVGKKKKTIQHKTKDNNGVIGVRVFEEDIPEINYAEIYKNESDNFNKTVGSKGVLFRQSNLSGHITNIGGAMIPLSSGAGGQSVMNGGEMYLSPRSLHSDVNQFGQLAYINSSYVHGPNDQANTIPTQTYAAAVAPSFDLGTAWGTKTEDKVREVSFNKSKTFVDIEIYYASRKSLEGWGIDFSKTKQIFGWPKAFANKEKYCKVPEGYNA